ncbi:MAG: ankyrin repeat domain-containing protein [Legionellales bacterium]|nr:ankyrin repeat domain-containing protein [Legionellales bacterium]
MSEELVVTVRNRGSIAEVTALLAEPGLNIDYQDANGMTALMEATLNLDIPMMTLLLTQQPKPTVDLEDLRGNTALNHVYIECEIDNEAALLPAINLLIANDVDVNHTSESDDTLIEWAAYNGHLDIVRRLLAVEGSVIGTALEDAQNGLAQEIENPGKYQEMIEMITVAMNPVDSLGSEMDDLGLARC